MFPTEFKFQQLPPYEETSYAPNKAVKTYFFDASRLARTMSSTIDRSSCTYCQTFVVVLIAIFSADWLIDFRAVILALRAYKISTIMSIAVLLPTEFLHGHFWSHFTFT